MCFTVSSLRHSGNEFLAAHATHALGYRKQAGNHRAAGMMAFRQMIVEIHAMRHRSVQKHFQKAGRASTKAKEGAFFLAAASLTISTNPASMGVVPDAPRIAPMVSSVPYLAASTAFLLQATEAHSGHVRCEDMWEIGRGKGCVRHERFRLVARKYSSGGYGMSSRLFWRA